MLTHPMGVILYIIYRGLIFHTTFIIFSFHPYLLTHNYPQVNSTWYEAGGPLFILLGGEGPASTVW